MHFWRRRILGERPSDGLFSWAPVMILNRLGPPDLLQAALSLLSAANILAGARLLVPKQCRAALRQCRAVFCDFCKSMACVADAGADDKVRKVVEQRVEAKVVVRKIDYPFNTNESSLLPELFR